MKALALSLLAGVAQADPVDLFRVACLEGAGSAAVPDLRAVPLEGRSYPGGAARLLSPDPDGFARGSAGPHLVLAGDVPAPEYCAVASDIPPGDARLALADVLVGARALGTLETFRSPDADHFLLPGERILSVVCPVAAEGMEATTILMLNDFAVTPDRPTAWEGFLRTAEAIPPGLPAAGTLRCVEGLA